MVRSLKNPKKAKRKNKVRFFSLKICVFIVLLSIFHMKNKLIKQAKKGEGSSDSVPSLPAKVWQPGVDKLEEGEELQCDASAYNSLHAFHIGWPCLRYFPRWFLKYIIQNSSRELVKTFLNFMYYAICIDCGCRCCSFDVLRDSLGLVRTEFPHSVYCVAGSQVSQELQEFSLFYTEFYY